LSDPAAEARAALDAAGGLPDDELDLAGLAIQFARIDRPDLNWKAGAEHISSLCREAVGVAARVPSGDAGALRAALGETLHGRGRFRGDRETYDDPDNANLLAVLQRRQGLPVALGILWLHLAEAIGVEAAGLDTPGHFLVSLRAGGSLVILDPFDEGRLLASAEGEGIDTLLRQRAPMSKRGVLLRLQNNLKVRRLQAGRAEAGLDGLEDMLRLAPEVTALWREAGLLNAELGRVARAIACFERVAALDGGGESGRFATAWLRELRHRLN
jgi:regulator of sirC expression with transglutaminase-like and TPR domain